MLEKEIAALSHFIKQYVDTHYFENLPQDIRYPSAYFPVPELHANEHSLNTYENSFALYIKVFHSDDLTAYAIASQVVNGIQRARKQIPLYDEEGKKTGRNFLVTKAEAKKIDDGVAQITLEWNSYQRYTREEVQMAVHLYYSGLATSVEKEEDKDGESSEFC